MKIYISGKISGLDRQEVIRKFTVAESVLVKQGHDVVNPLRNGIPYEAPWEMHIAMDIIHLISCDAIYLLPCWEESRGAMLERNIAELTGKKILYQETTRYSGIKRAIYEATGVGYYDVRNHSRKKNIVYAKVLFVKLFHDAGATPYQIAHMINRSESNVHYSLQKYQDDMRFTPEFKRLSEDVSKRLSKSF